MSIASSSINSKQIIKDSQQRLDDEAITTLNFKTIKGNQGGLLTTVNEMKGTFYEANDEFYNIVSQYIFLDLNIIYSAITQEARVLDKNDIFETYINDYYNERFMTCLNNYYKHSPVFFKTLFPNQTQNINKRNIHQSFQKYYYLLCIIQFVNDNYSDDRMTSLPLKFYNNIVNWCKTRNDPNIIYQLNGPNKNQVITFDFAKHYHSLISVQDTTQDINDYNKLVRLQNLDNGLLQLYDFFKNMPNVYNKNPNFANQYVLHVNTYDIKNKFVDADGKLVYDLAEIDFGDTTNDTTRAHIDEIDKLQTKDITLSKLNIKKLEKIFNMYNRLKIESLIVDKRTYINDISKYNIVYLVFEGVQCSDRTVGSNKNIASGDLAIPGRFTINSNGDYEFKTLTEYTTYRPERTRVRKCQLYLTTDNNKIISPYEINLSISKDDLYNIPLKIIDYNPNDNNYSRVTKNKQFPDVIFNNDNTFNAQNDTVYDEFISDNDIKKTYNGCYLMPSYDVIDNDIQLNKILYLYDDDNKIINVIETNGLTEDILYKFFMHEQHLTNTGYYYNSGLNIYKPITTETQLKQLFKYEQSNDIKDVINIDNPLITYLNCYAFRNYEFKHNLICYVEVFKNLIFTGINDETFVITLYINDIYNKNNIEIEMPLIPTKYSLLNQSNDIEFEYIITSSNNKYFDKYTININNGESYSGILPYNIELNEPNNNSTALKFRPFTFKTYTTLKFIFTLHKEPNKGLTFDHAYVSFNSASRIEHLYWVQYDNDETIIKKLNQTVIYYNNGLIYCPGAYGDDPIYKIGDSEATKLQYFYNDITTTNNILYNPLKCDEFYNKSFTSKILDNNISMITLADYNKSDNEIFNILSGGYINDVTSIELVDSYISTSLTSDKQYIESSILTYYPSSYKIEINDILTDELYIWRGSKSKYINIDLSYYEQTFNTDSEFKFNNDFLENTYLYTYDNTLVKGSEHEYFNNLLDVIKSYINNYNNSDILRETLENNQSLIIGEDLTITITGKSLIKNKNFIIIFHPNKLTYDSIELTVKIIKMLPIQLDILNDYLYEDNKYLYSIPMTYNNTYNLIHCFINDKIISSDIFDNKYINLIIPRIKAIMNPSYITINDTAFYSVMSVRLVYSATCHKLKIYNDENKQGLYETLIHTMTPDNYYSDNNYNDNNYFDILPIVGNDDYYKRFIYLYKHINIKYKYIIIKSDKNLSNYDNVIFDGVDINNFYIEKFNDNLYILINNSSNINIKNMNSSVMLNKNDMFLTISWS